MDLSLSDVERYVLRRTLEKAINEMLMEIANTDNRKMKEGLRKSEDILRGILEKLPPGVSMAA